MNTLNFIGKYYPNNKKMSLKQKTKKYLRQSSFFTIKPKDDNVIVKLKKTFIHSERSFVYGFRQYLVDSLYCHASPGTIEVTICELQKLRPAGEILNLGGGIGQVSDIFRNLGYVVYNIDLEISREKINDFNVQHNLNDYSPLPIADKKFDIVLCQEIIEHLENPWHLIYQAQKALKPGGIFIVSTPNTQSRWSRIRFLFTGYLPWFSPDCFTYHINPIFDWELKLIAEKNGLSLVKIKGNGDYYFNRRNIDQKKILAKNEELIYFFTKNK